jgi:hypothetical protein
MKSGGASGAIGALANPESIFAATAPRLFDLGGSSLPAKPAGRAASRDLRWTAQRFQRSPRFSSQPCT